MTYQQHSVLVEGTDFLVEVPVDATAAHLSSYFFSAAAAAATTDLEVSEAAAAMTTAASGSFFSCYAAAAAAITITAAVVAAAATTAVAANSRKTIDVSLNRRDHIKLYSFPCVLSQTSRRNSAGIFLCFKT